jgi:hypothetical protein
MKTNDTMKVNLESVLLEFRVEAEAAPSPAALEAHCRKYPQYARELTDYAVQWLIGDVLAATATGVEAAPTASNSLISRAISRFHDRVHSSAASLSDPFAGLSVPRKREIRDKLGIDTPLFARFQNRLVDPATVSRPFLERFAGMVERSVDDFVAYLAGAPAMHSAADFKAEGKPVPPVRKLTFVEAVNESTLDEKQKQALLKG